MSDLEFYYVLLSAAAPLLGIVVTGFVTYAAIVFTYEWLSGEGGES